jgi:hypothetical protein
MGAANYCEFRGMLMKSSIYFRGKVGMSLLRHSGAELLLGDHPRVSALHHLGIAKRPLFTVFFPSSAGVLDDHYEGWFVAYDEPPKEAPEGLESVANLGLSETWLPPPTAHGRNG